MKKTPAIALCLAMLLPLVGCGRTASPASSPTDAAERVIPYPSGYVIGDVGASAYEGSGDHADSRYFAHPDVFNLTTGGSLTVLSHYRTYQQTSESTCGPATALTVLYHYDVTEWDEDEIADIMQTSRDLNGSNEQDPGQADERGEWGTSTDRMLRFFEYIGWNISSSLDSADGDGFSFADPDDFKDWVIGHLKEGTPIMVEWIDWMGHWQAVIGYDTMGTDSFGDDVLIVADPYDTSDHLQDGYYIVPAERFFYMWADKGILPPEQEYQQWLIATPGE